MDSLRKLASRALCLVKLWKQEFKKNPLKISAFRVEQQLDKLEILKKNLKPWNVEELNNAILETKDFLEKIQIEEIKIKKKKEILLFGCCE